MESEVGIQLEDGSVVLDKTIVGDQVLDVKKEEGGDVNSENATNAEKGIGLSGGKVESSWTGLESKLSNRGKVTGAISKNRRTSIRPTINKATKMNGKESPSVTQGQSFPAKGLRANAISKSVDGYSTQSSAKHSGASRSKAEALVSNGTAKSVSQRASSGVSTNGESKGAASASIRLASVPTVHQSKSLKPVVTNGTATCPPPDGFSSADQPTKSDKMTLSSTEEDTHSPNSSNVAGVHCKSSTPGFSSRLEERAEKRREFFSKLEEKIHAKEVEKNDMQEKSKESQEAEIKNLRKSLKFKAAPLPSFYKEPPPKVQIKKMPTTRAKSPKLGRRKSFSGARNSLEEGSGLSPRVSKEPDTSTKIIQVNYENGNVSKRKPIRKSLPNLHPRESISSKTKGKSGNLKQRETVADAEDTKATANAEQESKTKSVIPPEIVDVKPEKISTWDNELLVNSANPSVQENEVIVNSGDPDIPRANLAFGG